MSSPSKIAKLLVQQVNSLGDLVEVNNIKVNILYIISNSLIQSNLKQKVPVESFWQNSPCVIIFFRRFGCQFCRLEAKELSNTVKPVLDKHNIK